MAWTKLISPKAQVKVAVKRCLVSWNEAAHNLTGNPCCVDLMFEEKELRLGLRDGCDYRVDRVDDDASFVIHAAGLREILEKLGVGKDFEATPELVDHSNGEVPGMVGAIAFKLPV